MTILNDDTIDAKLSESKLLVLKASAAWCGPCKAIKPVLAELDGEWDNVDFAEIDVDDCPLIVERFGINSMPRTYFIKDGVVQEMILGAKPKGDFEKAIKRLVA